MLVLAEAVQLLVVVGGEPLLQPVVPASDGRVQARAGPPEVGGFLGQQLTAVRGPHEAHLSLGADLHGQRPDGQ